jgi:hypothetical protein
MKIGFDIISDLYLSPQENFNWENKATSLYCIIAGNISSDLRIVRQTLLHLSKFYQGIFYIPGALEFEGASTLTDRAADIQRVCSGIRNVASLHNHVVIVDGIAIAGSNCWYSNPAIDDNMIVQIEKEMQRQEDIDYLGSTIGRLQLHLDVKKIVLVTNSVPGPELFFGEVPQGVDDLVTPQHTLIHDSEKKVTHWIYGSYGKEVDTVINDINYINNSCHSRSPYWAKRIEIEV